MSTTASGMRTTGRPPSEAVSTAATARLGPSLGDLIGGEER
ncbi:hypothetical protein [Streptomyces sp. AK02-01A]|nr:hypothetical protein [Streptomyces sp. AK02-01A]MDX3851681.1 hypothetical protein [Streptomyces sp. AK02-01A]